MAAAETLQVAIETTEAQQKALEKEIEALDPQPDTDSHQPRSARGRERVSPRRSPTKPKRSKPSKPKPRPPKPPHRSTAPPPIRTTFPDSASAGHAPSSSSSPPAACSPIPQPRPSHPAARQRKKAEKWLRAKEALRALRAVLAAIPKGTQVAVFQMSESVSPLSGSPNNPYIDPYDNAALITLISDRLDRLENLEAAAVFGADLSRGTILTVNNLKQRAKQHSCSSSATDSKQHIRALTQSRTSHELAASPNPSASASSTRPWPTAPTILSMPFSSPFEDPV